MTTLDSVEIIREFNERKITIEDAAKSLVDHLHSSSSIFFGEINRFIFFQGAGMPERVKAVYAELEKHKTDKAALGVRLICEGVATRDNDPIVAPEIVPLTKLAISTLKEMDTDSSHHELMELAHWSTIQGSARGLQISGAFFIEMFAQEGDVKNIYSLMISGGMGCLTSGLKALAAIGNDEAAKAALLSLEIFDKRSAGTVFLSGFLDFKQNASLQRTDRVEESLDHEIKTLASSIFNPRTLFNQFETAAISFSDDKAKSYIETQVSTNRELLTRVIAVMPELAPMTESVNAAENFVNQVIQHRNLV